jgi:hypothetical protein
MYHKLPYIWRCLTTQNSFTLYDERLVPDRLRGRRKSLDGDLNVDEEDSQQNKRNSAITTPRLCWLPTHAHTSWPRQEG